MAEQEWQESLAQLALLVNLVLLPFAGKYFGRKFAYFSTSPLTLCIPLDPYHLSPQYENFPIRIELCCIPTWHCVRGAVVDGSLGEVDGVSMASGRRFLK